MYLPSIGSNVVKTEKNKTEQVYDIFQLGQVNLIIFSINVDNWVDHID